MPDCYGAPSTVHDRFQDWREAGLFEGMWQAGLLEYDAEKGLEWEWQAIDGAMTKAPLGGAGKGANPTDRGMHAHGLHLEPEDFSDRLLIL